jgi:hypothetical protein
LRKQVSIFLLIHLQIIIGTLYIVVFKNVPVEVNAHPTSCSEIVPCNISAIHESKSIQVDCSPSSTIIADLQYQCKVLKSKLKRADRKYKKCLEKVKDLQSEINTNSPKLKILNRIFEDAENGNEKAIFLMDQVKNYPKKIPRWSELSVPSKTTISRYVGNFRGQNELIKQRLCAEISQLKVPVEKICSLVIDDMSIKEKVHYSRCDDQIYGLDTSKSNIVGKKPQIANKMLCFVIHGLSTKFLIPVGYFFHASLVTNDFFSLTMKILQMVTDCGFIVLRLVTDNISTNVALFKKFGNGSMKNYVNHPILEHIPLFLSFDYCHALKNARNLFLDHDMGSSNGRISSSYIKILHELQQGLPVKPVRFLTNKHLFPTNFEKMNVLRAVQIFSPAITSSLQFLKTEDDRFSDVDSTITYMKNMYYFFQIHNVSSRRHYIESLDSSVAPYTNISDERLEWLNATFPNYIDDIQNTSQQIGLKGLSNETAHALKFTAKSTCLCVKFLLQEAGFYYVLTRSFNSDAIEGMFSHIRLKGGSNDATDARTAEYAIRQILRCGIIKASSSANTATNVNFISSASNMSSTSTSDSENATITLPLYLQAKIETLKSNSIPSPDIYSASIAFLSGYVIKKIEDKFHCDECITSLVSTTLPGPLLQLIALQDRGGLIYPSEIFVGVVKKIADVILDSLPYLKYDKTCQQLETFLHPILIQNPIFLCFQHKNDVCQIILKSVIKPVLNNICSEKTEQLKSRTISNKPLNRKIFKL